MKKDLLVCLTFSLLLVLSINKNVYSLVVNNESKYAVFEDVYNKSVVKEGAREITYEQFMKIKNSPGKCVLFDVRSEESYKAGHIDGALSFPVKTINKATAEKRLTGDSKIIVYCASFECHASTQAAKTLSSLGYKVVDYKGGIKEWQEKGNKLEK